MFKKGLAICAVCASLAFAGVADPTLYTSGAAEPATPLVNVNYVENNEPMFAVSIHPVDMIFDAVWGRPSVMLTIEGNLNSRFSLITRPHLMWGEYTRGSKGSENRRTIDVFNFGVSEGIRGYFRPGHRGRFLAGHFLYNRVNLDYDFAEYPEANEKFKGNGFGGAFYAGHKYRSGSFTSSFEIGLDFVSVNYSIGYAS